MPALSPEKLVSGVLDALLESGHPAVLIGSARAHPRRFAFADTSGPVSLWVYIWTLTPGGRPQLENEYRIQMTGVSSPLVLNPAGRTVLLGYEPGLGMFAGFDLRRHRTFTMGSPSVQVSIETLRQALQDGLAFSRKDNNEIAVGVRPDHLADYCLQAEVLHRTGRSPEGFKAYSEAAHPQPLQEEDIQNLTAERQHLARVVNRLSRSANFRQKVLNAYGHRCAVTRMQLKLVDAAHILPVGAPESSDHVSNGIALTATYHRAFDAGLIYLSGDYVMKVNETRLDALRGLSLTSGLDLLKQPLGKIALPQDEAQWPRKAFIEKANVYRQIKTA